MKDLKIGLTHTVQKIVTVNDTATAFGSGDVEVFATPAMIALMEETALKSITPFLQENQTTVGFEICVKHLKAVRVNDKVISKTIVNEVDNRKIVFSLEVTHGEEIIGKGSHTRYIVDKDKFS